MATRAPTGASSPPDAAWMRERLDELCSGPRESASEGERRAAEWLAGELREAGARDVRVEEEPEANGTFWWPIGLLAGASAMAGFAARRGGRARRALAAVTGAAAAALIADELPPRGRRVRRPLPKSNAPPVFPPNGPGGGPGGDLVLGPHRPPPPAVFFHPG